MSNANKAAAAQTATEATSGRKEIGFFRSLASPIYAMGRVFSAAERVANTLDMYAEKLEADTELQLVPTLTRLGNARKQMAIDIASGKLDDKDEG